MLGPIVQGIVQAVNSFLKSPSTQRAIKYGLLHLAKQPETQRVIGEGFNNIVEFVQSIKIKVSYRTKEGDLVIESTKTTTTYYASNIKDSTVLQGNININNYTTNVNISYLDYKELQNINQRLKDITSTIDNSSKQKTELEGISNEVDNLSIKQEKILIKSTDYSNLQQILKSLNIKQ